MQIATAAEVLGPAARSEARALLASAAFGVADVAVELARPWPLALAIDAVVVHDGRFGLGAGSLVIACGVAGVALAAASGWVAWNATVRAERAAERVGARLRQRVFDHAMTLSLRWHDRVRSGELVSRLTTDVGRLLDALVAVCATVVPDALRLLVVLGLLVAIDPGLALVAVAVVPVLAVFATRQRRRVRGAQGEARAASGRLGATAVDLLRNVRAVQAFARNGQASAAFRIRNASVLDANTHAVATEAAWSPVADVTLAVGTGVVLAVGGHQALAGRLSPAQLIVIMAYLASLYSPVRSLSRLSGVLAKASASSARIQDVLRSSERIAAPVASLVAPPVRHSVRFTGVGFRYSDGGAVLDGFDLDVRAGETVCLLGPSGAGKSTVLHLLLRLYDVDAGAVLIDGIDIRHLDLTTLRRRIAFVPQDPWLLDASIAENIAFGSPDATRHGIVRAARTALVDEFAERLPHGYETCVGEGGAALSGGQRRRVALARAALSDAPLLLLDEPTASLDPASAAFVVDAIRRAAVGRTVLFVTHDSALAAIADRVVTLTLNHLPHGGSTDAWKEVPA